MQPPVWNIVGAGLGGSLMALYLAQKGFRVRLFERRPDPRTGKVDSGRSINLALSARGMRALQETGLLDEILRFALPMRGRRLHSKTGDLSYQPYSLNPENCIYSVSRAGLNLALIRAAANSAQVEMRFGVRCEEAIPERKALRFSDIYSGETFFVEDGPVIACDGAFSAVRAAVLKTPGFNYSQTFEDYGYKEITIAPAPTGGFAMDPEALHIWPRESFMLIALPNPDYSFTCTLFLRYSGSPGFDKLTSPAAARDFFRQYFPDALEKMPAFEQEFTENPVGSLVTVRCSRWVFHDWIALLGDSAHAIVPFYGQGMNAAFEDCSALNQCLSETPGDFVSAFHTYERIRRPNADAIADMALENFVEMRDHVGDPHFLFQKKIEHWLEANFPQYLSRYEAVSFSHTPYTEALRLGEVNKGILKTLAKEVKSVDEIDRNRASTLVHAAYGLAGE